MMTSSWVWHRVPIWVMSGILGALAGLWARSSSWTWAVSIPLILGFAVFASVWVDRWERRKSHGNKT